ncbi:MAG: NAD(+) synthase [Bacilli bacterium]|nr:NAD(+) synthase [Bacilli bacterium]
MTLEQYIDEIVSFLKGYISDKPFIKGYVLGVSGGVDSSLAAVLVKKAVGKENMMGILMPIDSNIKDLEDGIELCKSMDVPYKVVDATETFKLFKSTIETASGELDRSTLGNLKARMRMSVLYAYAQKHGYLVVGTDNADEKYTGYFTKYGDGAADILPIAHLLKGEVVKACKILGVPTKLAERVPTAGLFEGQTDETEMGVTYAELDAYLLGKEVSEDAKAKIERLHKVSEHKRIPIPTPKEFDRD